MAATYRVTVKGWDRQYGSGHVLFNRSFERRRRSKKADEEAIGMLEDAIAQNVPQSSDRSAVAWAEISDRYGPETLAKYENDNGSWGLVGGSSMRRNTHLPEDAYLDAGELEKQLAADLVELLPPTVPRDSIEVSFFEERLDPHTELYGVEIVVKGVPSAMWRAGTLLGAVALAHDDLEGGD